MDEVDWYDYDAVVDWLVEQRRSGPFSFEFTEQVLMLAQLSLPEELVRTLLETVEREAVSG